MSKRIRKPSTNLARKSVHREDTFGGIGGGELEVATWNSAAMLLVNSGHGGLPVAAAKGKYDNNMAWYYQRSVHEE